MIDFIMEYLPILIVAAVIGGFSIAFLIAYAALKRQKEDMTDRDRNMTDREIIGRLLRIRLAAHYEDNTPEGTEDGRAAANGLSSREKEVLRHIIKGKINKEIAMELGISLTTVIFHRNNICEKLKTRSIGKLTVFAVLSGLIELNEI